MRTIRGLGQDDGTSFITDFSVPGSPTQPIDPSLYSTLPAVTPSGGYDVADVMNDTTPTAATIAAGTSPGSVANIPSSGILSLAQQAGNVIAAATTGTTGRGPSSTVQIPLSSSSIGMWLENATLFPGVPNWEVIFGTIALIAVGGSLLGGRRRRR